MGMGQVMWPAAEGPSRCSRGSAKRRPPDRQAAGAAGPGGLSAAAPHLLLILPRSLPQPLLQRDGKGAGEAAGSAGEPLAAIIGIGRRCRTRGSFADIETRGGRAGRTGERSPPACRCSSALLNRRRDRRQLIGGSIVSLGCPCRRIHAS